MYLECLGLTTDEFWHHTLVFQWLTGIMRPNLKQGG